MDAPELYRQICTYTVRFTFTSPVTDEDLAVFVTGLQEVVPADHRASATLEGPYVLVQVRRAAAVRYERRMIIE